MLSASLGVFGGCQYMLDGFVIAVQLFAAGKTERKH